MLLILHAKRPEHCEEGLGPPAPETFENQPSITYYSEASGLRESKQHNDTRNPTRGPGARRSSKKEPVLRSCWLRKELRRAILSKRTLAIAQPSRRENREVTRHIRIKKNDDFATQRIRQYAVVATDHSFPARLHTECSRLERAQLGHCAIQMGREGKENAKLQELSEKQTPPYHAEAADTLNSLAHSGQ